MLKTVIIDDEPLVRKDLLRMLSKHPDIDIIGEAGTIPEAEKMLRKVDCDAVFLDVQLIGGTGFDLVPLIPPTTRIIFFTAYDEFAIRAFEVNALDYLLKPVRAERLAAALDRLRVTENRQAGAKVLGGDDRILIKTNQEQRFVFLREVAAVTSIGGNYTQVHLKNDERQPVRRTLAQWEALLPEDLFLRIHHTTIVNLDHIDKINRKNGSSQIYLYDIQTPFSVSRRSVGQLNRRIENGSAL